MTCEGRVDVWAVIMHGVAGTVIRRMKCPFDGDRFKAEVCTVYHGQPLRTYYCNSQPELGQTKSFSAAGLTDVSLMHGIVRL